MHSRTTMFSMINLGAIAVNASRSPLFGKPILRFSAGLLIAIGLALAFLAIFADSLDIGGGKGFGYQQLIGLIGGIVLMLWGLAIVFQKYLNASNRDAFEVER